MYRHILFPHDGSELAIRAEKECIALAKTLGAKVTAIRVVGLRDFIPEEGVPRVVRSWVENELDSIVRGMPHGQLAELKKHAGANGVECDVVVKLGGEPFKGIVEQAAESKCDLIVMASHGRTGIEIVWRGSQTVKVLSRCKVPVLVIRSS